MEVGEFFSRGGIWTEVYVCFRIFNKICDSFYGVFVFLCVWIFRVFLVVVRVELERVSR